ncbi:MAG TPA: bifunctional phosphopantothenoylcysteine decarboxylase/phosphopantothenate--cysteine ligase CoaBC [Gemmatimonadales bacterium]|nr:bifunctional phosphopantothenoylcysteine decarboxylase/phosphopantothenate--cysteine ligase CoaBC [Gemmatimonadales bacterium]HRZ08960.1 bifunctional phosphopantothenoylcysteine decarboxylase/phosphopantothenate--cysteine ligase CoaBC [Gemmatimonadales bacterium]
MWAGRHVVLGVSGGIACYKSCILARRLTEAGARVDVVLTRAAAEFVRPLTFEALTGRPVLTSLWEPDRALAHVRLADAADLVIVAPATAQLLARAAQGLADDVLTALLLARTGPVLAAPAMNDSMYAQEATGRNVAALAARGWAFVGPEVGPLAEGPSDRPGRMSEPESILAHAARLLRRGSPLAGRTVVVTAGPTREPIDPVRVVTNRSSGKMGYRLAEAAWERGADVVLVSGPVNLAAPVGVRLRSVETTEDLEKAVAEELPQADVLIMAAAPADYRPSSPSDAKHPRTDGALAIPMEPTADILRATIAVRKRGSVIVGFALETGDAIHKARTKLEGKALDLIVVNDALEPGAGFDVDTNRVAILDREGNARVVPLASKREVADTILDAVEARLG